jgi:hypothetical protein
MSTKQSICVSDSQGPMMPNQTEQIIEFSTDVPGQLVQLTVRSDFFASYANGFDFISQITIGHTPDRTSFFDTFR